MLNILIADDEKYERDSVIQLISDNFKDELRILEAKNGREAIEVAENFRVDIVIMDIKMPGINGIKAIEEIRKISKDTYFIMLTAYDYFDFAKEAVTLNVKEYLLKPFSRAELIQKIDSAIYYVSVEKDKRRNEIENQEKINNLVAILESDLSYNIINNTLDAIDYEMYLDNLKLDFKRGIAIVVKINELERGYIVNNKKIGEFLNEYLKQKYKTIGTYKFTNELVYFLELGQTNEDVNVIKLIIANSLIKEVKRVFNLAATVGSGGVYSCILDMHKSYKEALSEVTGISNLGNLTSKEIIKSKKMDQNNKAPLFKKVEEYIEINIKEELDLARISKAFNLSPYYFSRSFKEAMGVSLTDYINQVKIKKAKELLKSIDFTVKEVCYEVGYTDPNYFSKVFKKYEGITPTEYKYL